MINKVILLGNLGRDPELRYTQSGTAVATLNIATGRRRRDQDGNYISETEWHRVIAWSKTAEYCGNYLHKGSMVYIEGRLQTRKWTDQNNIDRYTTEIVAETLQNLTPKNTGGGGGGYMEPPLPDDPYMSGGGSQGFGGDAGGTGGSNELGSNDPFGSSDTSSGFGDAFKGSKDDFGGDDDDGTGDDTPF